MEADYHVRGGLGRAHLQEQDGTLELELEASWLIRPELSSQWAQQSILGD
jgi:hypothetical protein